MRQTVITPLPSGASRVLDLTCPMPNALVLATTTIQSAFMDRQGLNTDTLGIQISSNGGTSQWVNYKGRVAYRFSGTGVQTNWIGLSNASFQFPQEKPTVTFQDDYRCWQISAIMAFDSAGPSDIGLSVGPAMNFDVVLNGQLGFIVMPLSLTTVGVKVRKTAGPFSIEQTLKTNFDITQWHLYQMRFIGATQTTEALFKVLIDSTPLFQASWAGGLLPGFTAGASAIGYGVALGNRGGAGAYLPMAGWNIAAAATEAGLI